MNDKERTLSGSKDELMSFIGALALNLHMNRSEELSCELPPEKCGPFPERKTEDYLIDGNTVRFASIEARNRCVATYEFEKNRTVFVSDARMWFSTAHDLWRCEIGKTDSAAGRLLALVHETDDIFSIAASAIESESVRVFDALQAVEAMLPYLNELTADGIFKLCAAQYERTKNDLASGIIFSELEKCFVKQPNTARAIHGRFRNDIAEATANLHPTALLALAKSSPGDAVSLTLEDAESPNVILKSVALWTLGRLLALALVPVDQMQLAVATLLASLSSPDDRVRQTAIRAAAHAAPVMDAFDESLIMLGEAGDQYALSAIANTLLMNMREMRSKANFNDWLRLLCKLSPSSKDAINSFDCVLSQLIRVQAQQQFAISCLTDWVSIHAKDAARDKSAAELFDGTTHELSNRPDLLSQVITDWFLSDNKRLASAAAGLLSYCEIRGLRNPEFSKSRLDTLERKDLLFLARRMAGFILSENHLLSLTMSFLKTDDARQRTFGIVYSLLVDELGQDYPSSTVEALESAKSATTDTEWTAFYSKIIEAINGRINALDALPRLAELRPPPKLQRQFEKAREKQMTDGVEEARKGSVIRQLATEITIKAGIGVFSFRDGGYTETTHMQSFSHSVSVPRRNALDTVGYEISRWILRNIKREDP